mgnify:CR=1 FL=1
MYMNRCAGVAYSCWLYGALGRQLFDWCSFHRSYKRQPSQDNDGEYNHLFGVRHGMLASKKWWLTPKTYGDWFLSTSIDFMPIMLRPPNRIISAGDIQCFAWLYLHFYLNILSRLSESISGFRPLSRDCNLDTPCVAVDMGVTFASVWVSGRWCLPVSGVLGQNVRVYK